MSSTRQSILDTTPRPQWLVLSHEEMDRLQSLADSVALRLGQLDPNDHLFQRGIEIPLAPTTNYQEWANGLRDADVIIENRAVVAGMLPGASATTGSTTAGISFGAIRQYGVLSKLGKMLKDNGSSDHVVPPYTRRYYEGADLCDL
jgi:hypothetical protein